MTYSRQVVLEIQGVHHWFGANHVLHDVNLRILRGQIVGLVGPSGCGKSTLLQAILGTHPPRRGRVLLQHKDGRMETVLTPHHSRGIVYQNYSLFDFLTAQQNVALGLMFEQISLAERILHPLRWRKMKKDHLNLAAAMLEKLGMGHALKRYPYEMSGGMRQRVAIGQALILRPDLLLLDEPFGALDEATRETLQELMLTLYAENCDAIKNGRMPPYTIVIVTHELNEAIYVGDRVVGLSQYWNWREQGHRECPGATIVYDKKAPVFLPNQDVDHEIFKQQRDEIRSVAFDSIDLQNPADHLTFWRDVENGLEAGILQ